LHPVHHGADVLRSSADSAASGRYNNAAVNNANALNVSGGATRLNGSGTVHFAPAAPASPSAAGNRGLPSAASAREGASVSPSAAAQPMDVAQSSQSSRTKESRRREEELLDRLGKMRRVEPDITDPTNPFHFIGKRRVYGDLSRLPTRRRYAPRFFGKRDV